MRYSYSELVKVDKPSIGTLNSCPDRAIRINSIHEILKNTIMKAPEKANHNPFVSAAVAHKFKCTLESMEKTMRLRRYIAGIETSMGKTIEKITGVYGWERVLSEGHTELSEIDLVKLEDKMVRLATLKSGPYCMNDSMANRIGCAVAEYAWDWCDKWGKNKLAFYVGLAYSSHRRSNKKHWHCIRIAEQQFSKQKDVQILKSCLDGKKALSGFIARKNNKEILVKCAAGVSLWDIITGLEKGHTEICYALSLFASNSNQTGSEWLDTFNKQLFQ